MTASSAGREAHDPAASAPTDARAGEPPVLDRFLPSYDLRSVVELPMPGPRPAAYRALRAVTPRQVPLLLVGLWLRALPERLLRGRGPVFPTTSPIFDGFRQNGFVELEERPDHAYSIGGIGRFWRPADNEPIKSLEAPRDFVAFDRPGYVKLASCHLVLDRDRECTIRHEIRMAGTDPQASALFARYWRLIGRPSRMLRLSALRAIRRHLAAGRAKPAG